MNTTCEFQHDVDRFSTLLAFRNADLEHNEEVARTEAPRFAYGAKQSVESLRSELTGLQRQLRAAQWRLALGRLLWGRPTFGH